MTSVKDECRVLRWKMNEAPICYAKICDNKNSDKKRVSIIGGTARLNSQKRLTKNIVVEIIMQTARGGTSTCLSLRAYLSVQSNSMVNFLNPEFPYQSRTFPTRRCLHQHLFHLLLYTKLYGISFFRRGRPTVFTVVYIHIYAYFM